jgi:hypothetical protein
MGTTYANLRNQVLESSEPRDIAIEFNEISSRVQGPRRIEGIECEEGNFRVVMIASAKRDSAAYSALRVKSKAGSWTQSRPFVSST